LGSTAISITGSGKVIVSRTTGSLLVAERVAGGGVLQTGQRDDVAREGLFDLLAVVGVHHHHAADALFLALGRVQDRVALLHHCPE
jgi:hypothetical protein